MKAKQLVLIFMVSAVTGIASWTGPARAECVTGTAYDTATQKYNFCTGAFNTAPYNATWTIFDSGIPAINYTLYVNTLTENIVPDWSHPGAALLRYGKSGTDRGTSYISNGEHGGNAPAGDPQFPTQILLDFNTPNYSIHAGGATTGSALNQMGHGLVAISRGGNGGRGGNSYDILFGVGGNGGNAAPGETVRVLSYGYISTAGTSSHGILAQSLGGNGGRGGDGYSSGSGEGGRGGNAAGGGTASVTSWSDIYTNGQKAHGIMAQSAGGRAGAGGNAGGIVGEGGLGGTAAPGGSAGVVTNAGDITTLGNGSIGIFAQSMGGFGGAGGDGGGIVGWGASGASAGDGGTASIISRSSVTTSGNDAHGIFAQSVGGGGGIGGDGVGIVGLGAAGAIGGAGAAVNVRTLSGVNAPINTSGARSIGLFAESIGGGGGDGGSAAGLVSLGGTGSATSPGGAVTVENSSPISTIGVQSHALLAQSIGGGGGNGGASLGLFTIGGDGGGGGDGGLVRVSNLVGFTSGSAGRLRTEGDYAVGLFAQSIGGGGGNGGAALAGGPGFAMSIGGKGGSGGDGGNVEVNPFVWDISLTPTGSIGTGGFADGGDKAHGIQAQSIGGGGGNGGFAFAGSVGEGASAAVALGGNGGAGGDAGTVLVNQHGNIQTSRWSAHGIFAQSVGGGGGDGGGSLAAAISGGKSVSFAMGGKGGTGGKGSTVDVNYVGTLQIGGEHSNGIFAQSLGGGGGNGGFSAAASLGQVAASFALGGDGGVGSEGSDVTVNVLHARQGATSVAGIIGTSLDFSNGIFAQSVGGGGGNGGFAGAGSLAASSVGSAIGLAMGGDGAGGAAAGNVDVSNVNTIWTFGTKSVGILAQSVGGGGGNGGFSLTAGGGGGKGLSAALGGSGGAGSNGGLVNVANSGDIVTQKTQSYGIFAQSLGGGGGNGGFAFSSSSSMQLADTTGKSASISIGGKGGQASHGSTVTVDNTGSVSTAGIGAHAVFAQSEGGGGGNGGWAGSIAINSGDGGSLGVNIGGAGAGGGNGGAVVLNSGIGVSGDVIQTSGKGAVGLFAQSLGGGGGDGGFGFAGAFGYRGGMTRINAAVGIGGTGGVGGTGSTVDVDNRSGIITRGEESNGITAQSIGGGGGNGGFAVSGTLSWANPTPGARTWPVGLTVGGEGGVGNFAGNVSVSNSETITTLAKDSKGIFAKSLGGGGGDGGLAITTQFTGPSANSFTLGSAIGGSGGSGNSAGTVTVTNTVGGVINTGGMNAHGIQAMSLGGGGGNGGLAVTAALGKAGATGSQASQALVYGVALGGDGGDNGAGSTVKVTNSAAINVGGESASGIFAQSAGGGGGHSGDAVSAIGLWTDTDNASSRSFTANITIGGDGGAGNHGGDVNVSNAGTITTQKGNGYGIFAQSLGGGGGIGGRANSLKLAVGNKCALPVVCNAPDSAAHRYSLGATVGGDNGSAGDGGAVTVTNDNTIETHGHVSDGIFAQSLGGGGGLGGNGVLGSEEISPFPAEIVAVPWDQVSVAKNINLVVGGNAGASGNGARVDVINNSDITTHGSNSAGIFAESTGGGGGVGGRGVVGLTGTLGIGGKAGAGGHGGIVFVNHTAGTIETFGDASSGIFAQSIGGGGGMSGNVDRMLTAKANVVTGLVNVNAPKWNVGIGGAVGQSGGAGGNGSAVIANVQDSIVTHGNSAFGVMAQSVGGGGGMLGDLGYGGLGSWAVGSNGDAGYSGQVIVTANADISTAGNSATGIFAQSAAGSDFASTVRVTINNASVRTGEILDSTLGGRDRDIAGNPIRGFGAVGIMAQSVGNGANNSQNRNITIDINGADSVVMGGRSGIVDVGVDSVDLKDLKGVGIAIIDGNQNTINNQGLVTTQDGVAGGFAILATGSNRSGDPDFNPAFAAQEGGNETVNNFGTVTGTVSLGAGQDAFNNEAGAIVNAGELIDLGVGEVFTNSGTISPGGSDNVFTTTLHGDLVQTITGVIDLDVLGTSESEIDRLFVTGEFSLGGGTALFNLTDDLTIAEFTQSLTVFDFFLGGTPDAPTMLSDYTLFDDLIFMGMDSISTFDLLLASDGSFTASAVPLPAAVWLFGSGLLALAGIYRRKKSAD
jgi:hypothetical protein